MGNGTESAYPSPAALRKQRRPQSLQTQLQNSEIASTCGCVPTRHATCGWPVTLQQEPGAGRGRVKKGLWSAEEAQLSVCVPGASVREWSLEEQGREEQVEGPPLGVAPTHFRAGAPAGGTPPYLEGKWLHSRSSSPVGLLRRGSSGPEEKRGGECHQSGTSTGLVGPDSSQLTLFSRLGNVQNIQTSGSQVSQLYQIYK